MFIEPPFHAYAPRGQHVKFLFPIADRVDGLHVARRSISARSTSEIGRHAIREYVVVQFTELAAAIQVHRHLLGKLHATTSASQKRGHGASRSPANILMSST